MCLECAWYSCLCPLGSGCGMLGLALGLCASPPKEVPQQASSAPPGKG